MSRRLRTVAAVAALALGTVTATVTTSAAAAAPTPAAPSDSAPLVTDIGIRPTGAASTTEVADIGARATAGVEYAVAERAGDWTAIWWLGQKAWFENPVSAPTAIPVTGSVVVPKAGRASVPVYGRAYPESSAYTGTGVPDQGVAPLVYTLKPGQKYVLADADVPTDFYRATTYDWSTPRDGTAIVGTTKYYEIWFGHRIAFVQAKDVQVH